jgi:hypothetical protein
MADLAGDAVASAWRATRFGPAWRLPSVTGIMRILKMFRPEVEVAVKLLLVAGLTGAYLVTFAWGYEARQDARRWRELACTYRLSELQRTIPGEPGAGSACDTLHRVGLTPLARLTR